MWRQILTSLFFSFEETIKGVSFLKLYYEILYRLNSGLFVNEPSKYVKNIFVDCRRINSVLHSRS